MCRVGGIYCCGNSDCMLGPLSVIFVCLSVFLFVCLFVCFCLFVCLFCWAESYLSLLPGAAWKEGNSFTPFLPTISHPRSPDLIVEVAHPSISAEFGATFLQTADFMVL